MLGGDDGSARQCGVQFGDHGADLGRRVDRQAGHAIARGIGDQLDRPRPTVHGAGKVFVDTCHKCLGMPLNPASRRMLIRGGAGCGPSCK